MTGSGHGGEEPHGDGVSSQEEPSLSLNREREGGETNTQEED